jgi:hypothetical protein
MTVILETLLLALTQPPAGAAATMPTCSLVTPRGDRIEFFIWSGDDPGQFNFTGVPGSAWPTRTLAGTRQNLEHNVPWFVIGGSDGVALMLNAPGPGGRRRAATIVGRGRILPTVPLAYGFCEERPAPETAEPPADLTASEASGPVFNSDLWPAEDCALLLSDGRRVRFTFTLNGTRDVRIQSPALWSGAPVTTALHWDNRQGRARFNSPNGPEGEQLLVVNGSLAAKAIVFRRLGGGEPPGLTGYGICGYRGVDRRPNLN